jgi:outer membrane protein
MEINNRAARKTKKNCAFLSSSGSRRGFIILFMLASSLGAPADSFANGTLQWAIDMAMQRNLGLQKSRIGKEQAQVSNHWGSTGALPYIYINTSLSAMREHSQASRNTNAAAAGPQLSWVLFDGLGARAAKDKLELQEELSGGQLAMFAEIAAAQVSAAYYAALLAAESKKAVENQLDIAKSRFLIQEELRNIGAIGSFELLQAKTDWLEFQAAYAAQEIAEAGALRNLCLAIGIELEELPPLAGSLEKPAAIYTLPELEQQTIGRSAPLKNQYLMAQIRQAEIKQATSKMLPRLSLSAGTELFWADTETAGKQALNSGLRNQAGLSLTVPLYDGGQRRRRAQVARLAAESENIASQEMEAQIRAALANAYDSYTRYAALAQWAGQLAEASRLNYQLTEERNRNGSVTSMQLREAQQRLIGAELSLLNTVYLMLINEIEILRISGAIAEQ